MVARSRTGKDDDVGDEEVGDALELLHAIRPLLPGRNVAVIHAAFAMAAIEVALKSHMSIDQALTWIDQLADDAKEQAREIFRDAAMLKEHGLQ